MNNLLKFINGNRKYLLVNDLKYFFKEDIDDGEAIQEQFKATNLNLRYQPILNVNNEVQDDKYILNEYMAQGVEKLFFICDDFDKTIFLNESNLVANLRLYFKITHLNNKLKKFLSKNKFETIDDVKSDIAQEFKQKFLNTTLGDYSVVGISDVFNDLKKDINKYIFDNIDDLFNKLNLPSSDIEYTQDEIKKNSKHMFVELISIDDFLALHDPKIDYNKLLASIYNNNSNFLAFSLYNYYKNKDELLGKIEEIIKQQYNKVNNYNYLLLQNLYIAKKAKDTLDLNKDCYENDEVLMKMRGIKKILKPTMKNLIVNGDTVKNSISFNFEKEIIIFKHPKKYNEYFEYKIKDGVEIKYGKKVLFKS